MWRRFAGGSTKRKCGVVEIEEGEEEMTSTGGSSAVPSTSAPTSSRRHDETATKSGLSRITAVSTTATKPFSPRPPEESALNGRRSGSVGGTTVPSTSTPISSRKRGDRRSSTGFPKVAAVQPTSTPISSRRRTLPAVVAPPPPAPVASFRRFSSPFSRKRSHSSSSLTLSPIVVKSEVPSQLSTTAIRAPSFKRGVSSASVFSTPRTPKREPTASEDEVVIEVSQTVTPPRPSVRKKEAAERDEEVVIEMSQGVTPQKQRTAEEVVIEQDVTLLTQSEAIDHFVIPGTQDLSFSSPSVDFARPTVTRQPTISPPKKTKRRFNGLAGRLATQLAAARADRVMARRDPNLDTIEVLIEETVRCWGVTASSLASGQQLLFRRREAPGAAASKGPASCDNGPAPARRRLVLPLAQLRIHAGRPPAVLHPIFASSDEVI